MKKGGPHVSIVLPVYNGSAFIEQSLNTLHGFLESQPWSYEVIVVDDGSLDNTLHLIRNLSPPLTKILSLPHRGKGSAVKAGVLSSEGDKTIFTDADLPYPLDLIPQFVNHLDRYPLVIAFRPIKRGVTLKRTLLTLGSLMVLKLLRLPYRDTQAGLKGMQGETGRAMFKKLTIKGFAFDIELLTIAGVWGLKVKEAPVEAPEEGEVSTVRWTDAFRGGAGTAKILLRSLLGLYNP
jgi:dolichyl-phosphate beta-glucosyltransferase